MNKDLQSAEAKIADPSWVVRVEGIQSASKWINIRSQNLLLSTLNDTHQRVRIEAIKGLSLFRSIQSFEEIKRIAETEKDLPIRLTALQSLAQFQNPRASRVFISALEDDEWMVREIAISGLLDIPDPAIESISIQFIVNALSDSNENVRIAALTHLRIKNDTFYYILRAQVADENIYVRPVYLKALLTALRGYKFDDSTRRRLMGLITHPNAEIRSLAYQSIKISDQLTKSSK